MDLTCGVLRMTHEGERDRLIAAGGVGEILHLSKRTISRLNAQGKIPAPLRVGGAVRWSVRELTEWLAAGAPDRQTWERMKQGT
jgi:predicted DNA-binding transcriptional regulator AlpA